MRYRRFWFAILALAASALPVGAASVTITRDRWGVPHIFIPPTFGGKAAQIRASSFAQGYATAQDRMVQLEFFRRAGKGRLSEIAFLGPSYLPGDIIARRDGFTDAEFRTQFKKLPRKVRMGFEGFRDGVNRFLEGAAADPSKSPAEFLLLGLNPEPWDVTDTMAVAMLQIRRFGQNGGQELRHAVLLLDLLDRFPSAEARGMFTDLVWQEDPTSPTTIDPGEQTFTPPPTTPFAAQQLDLITQYDSAIRGTVMARRTEETLLAWVGETIGFPFDFPASASNAMVIAGSLTESGNPILLGGPQVGLSIPSFFYQVGVHGGGYDASGIIVPVGPGLIIGRSANAAWTLTSGITDNTDIYIEVLNPSNPKQYMFEGKFRDMECRTEIFKPATLPEESHEFCRTVHGPVIASVAADGVAFSRHLHFFGREGIAAANLVSLGFATNLRKFKRTIDKLEASLNCMYADTTGTIAYFHRGLLPSRPAAFDPRLPLPGTGEAEPGKPLKGKKMPTAINPASGFIAQWNNKPIRGWPADDQQEAWGGVHRVQALIDQIVADKTAGHKITADDVGEYMRKGATTDLFAARIFPFLRAAVDALPPSTPDLAQLDGAADLIEAWIAAGAPQQADGTGKVPYAGLTIHRAWRTRVQTDTFGDELGTHVRPVVFFQTNTERNADDSGSSENKDALFLRALQYPSATFPTSRDYFLDVIAATNPGRDATLVESLRAALMELAAQFGTTDMTQWLTPKITTRFSATSAADILYGPTVMEYENRGSFNELLELGPTITGRIVVPPGNSAHITLGDPEPAHLRDQLPLYEGFQYHPFPFAQADLEAPTTEETIDVP